METVLPCILSQDTIKKIIEDEGYVTFNTEIQEFDSKCRHFLSEVYAMNIKGNTDQGEKETNLFIKKKITLTKMHYFPVNEFFPNELFLYTELSKIFTYLQDQANVPPEERYRIAKTYDGTKDDVIVLENLTIRNFRAYNRADILPPKYNKLAIIELAKFHGLSFVMENKMPEYYNSKIKTIDNLLCFDDDWQKYMHKVCRHIAKMYDDSSEYDIKKKIENFLPVILDKFPKYNSNKLPVKNVLTHGDYRMYNVLVREQDGEPVEVVPIDYQLISYGCPIRDFLYFVFTGTDQEFRNEHLDNLKELYFESLSKFLKYFDIDVEAVYPRSEYEEVYSEWLDYGLMNAFFATAFIFAPETDEDVQDVCLTDMPLNFDERAKRMLRGWVEDYIKWGIL